MIGAEITALLDWLDTKIAAEERTLATRKLIAAEQAKMSKHHPVQVKRDPELLKNPVVLTHEARRTLLCSGKTRCAIRRETGWSYSVIDNYAAQLGIKLAT